MITLKQRYLRVIANYRIKRLEKALEALSKEQRLIYNVAVKIIASSNSMLDISPESGDYYVKYNLMALKIDINTVHLINGKYSYATTFERLIIEELKEMFHRHKETSIKKAMAEISIESQSHLEKIYFDLVNII